MVILKITYSIWLYVIAKCNKLFDNQCELIVNKYHKHRSGINPLDFFHFTFYTLMLLVITGGIVGFLLALTGGGGSIVCVPLLLYMVQIPDTHLVIGTSAMSVAVSALLNLFAHAAKGNVRWRTGIVVSLVAVAGTLAGSQMGKITDGRYLTLPFALLMLIVAGLTLKKITGPATDWLLLMRPFIPPSCGPACWRWARWPAFWGSAADF